MPKEDKSTPAIVGKDGKKKTWFCGVNAKENSEKAKNKKAVK